MNGLMNNGKWRGTIKARCGVCNYSQDVEVTLSAGQFSNVVEWHCPRCEATSKIRVERQSSKEVEV